MYNPTSRMDHVYTEKELKARECITYTIERATDFVVDNHTYEVIMDITNILKEYGTDLLTYKEKEQLSNIAKIINNRFQRESRMKQLFPHEKIPIDEAIQYLVNLI